MKKITNKNQNKNKVRYDKKVEDVFILGIMYNTTVM